MAVFTATGGERLFELVSRFYGAVTDANLDSVLYANPISWDGNGVIAAGTVLTIPEPVLTIPYPTTTTQEIARLHQLLEGRDAATHPSVGDSLNMSAKTGGYIDEPEAVRQDVVNRVLTYRGHREWRVDYGTRMLHALYYTQREVLATAAVTAAQQALAPASERYQVDSVTAGFQDDALVVTVIVTPLFGLDPIDVSIPFILPDLT